MANSLSPDLFQQSIDLVLNYANCLKEYYRNESTLSSFNELEPYVLHFAKVKEVNRVNNEVFKEVITNLTSSPDDVNSDYILQQFNQKVQTAAAELEQENFECYDNLKQIISEVQKIIMKKNDDDIVEVFKSMNKIDPITQLPIVDPVKNKNCGHVYEKSSIYHLFKKNSVIKCPIPSCTETSVKKSDLKEDQYLKRMLANEASDASNKKVKVNQ